MFEDIQQVNPITMKKEMKLEDFCVEGVQMNHFALQSMMSAVRVDYKLSRDGVMQPHFKYLSGSDSQSSICDESGLSVRNGVTSVCSLESMLNTIYLVTLQNEKDANETDTTFCKGNEMKGSTASEWQNKWM